MIGLERSRRSRRAVGPHGRGRFSVAEPACSWKVAAVRGLVVALLALPGVTSAQVLAIGTDGGVTLYDGAAVYTAQGATPIQAPPPRRAPRPAAMRDGAALKRAAVAAELSPELVAAVAWRESGGRSDRISRAGAVGEMQLTPATARGLGVDASVPAENLKGGAAYLRVLMRRYDGDLVRALAAYNAGPKTVDRFGGVPPYRETQAYVAAVLDRLSQAVVPIGAGSWK